LGFGAFSGVEYSEKSGVKTRSEMKWKVGVLVLLLSQIAFADSTIQQAQETLKEQGFYFGQITGEKNADTTAAIRRFQIRNGLQVTGELNEETLRALNSNPAAVVQTGTPAPQRNESNTQPEQDDDLRSDVSPQQPGPISPRPPQTREMYPAPQAEPRDDVFGDTPYATAPPQLQRQVLLGVETSLRRRGLYRGQVDGAFGPELESALRAYQSRLGLVASGRLDMDTLASLGLLPGQHAPHLPRRRNVPEPPVRGEWVH
jgi:peptidoglycan hydrolase-like protein with peptidoglycan-binding domain